MAVQGDTIELREHEYFTKPAIEAVTDRNIHQAIFTCERDSGFGALFGERKEARTGATSHDNCEGFVGNGGPILEAHDW